MRKEDRSSVDKFKVFYEGKTIEEERRETRKRVKKHRPPKH